MQTYKVLLILVGILILVFFIYGIYKLIGNDNSPHVKPQVCDSPDCKDKTRDCNIMDYKLLSHCVPNDKDDPCYNCFGDMTCQVVKDDTYFINKTMDECIHPYVWNEVSGQCSIPVGSYCLPFMQGSIQCNQFTGRKMLGKVSTHAPYEWLCVCRDDTKFTNNGISTSDCDRIRVCDMDGAINPVVKPVDNSRYLVNKLTGELWNAETSNWNPNTDGMCYCGIDGVPSAVDSLSCVGNSCEPGHPTPDGKKCICQPKYIDCASIVNRFGYSTGICQADINSSTCVPDPCYPGYYDPNLNNGSGGCFCDKEYDGTPLNGYIDSPSVNSIVGEICVNWCDTSQNPCSDRGTCSFSSSGGKDDDYIMFVFDYISSGSNSGKWLISSKLDYSFLQISNNNLVLSSSGGYPFIIEAKCATNPCPKIDILDSTAKYYFKLDGGKYVDINPSGNYMVVDTIDKANPWQFVSNGNVPGGSTQIGKLFVVGNLYVSNNKSSSTSSPSLYLGASRINYPICNNCIAPYAQNTGHICSDICILNGEDVNNDNECCSCDSVTYEKCTDAGFCVKTIRCSGSGGNKGDNPVYDKSKNPNGCP